MVWRASALSPAWQASSQAASAGDVIDPTLVSITINPDGDQASVVLSEAVTIGAGGSGGFTLSNGAVGTYVSGAGTDTLLFSLSPVVEGAETVTGNYTQPSNGITDLTGNELQTFSAQSVTNNSTVSITISDVNTTNIIEYGSAGNVVTGLEFGASEGTLSINGVNQTITAWSDTSIAFTHIAGVLDAQTLSITNTNGSNQTLPVEIAPPAGYSFIVLATYTTASASNLMYGYTNGTPENGDFLVAQNPTQEGEDFTQIDDGEIFFTEGAPAVTQTINRWIVKANGTVHAADDFSYTVAGADTTPDQFTFSDVTGAELSTTYEDIQAITGVDAGETLAVTNGETSNTGIAGTYDSTNKAMVAGQSYVKSSVTSSASYSTAATQTPTVNGVGDVFSVTTRAAVAPSLPATLGRNVAEGTNSVTFSAASGDPTITYALTGDDAGLFTETTGLTYTLASGVFTVGATFSLVLTASSVHGPDAVQTITLTVVEPTAFLRNFTDNFLKEFQR